MLTKRQLTRLWNCLATTQRTELGISCSRDFAREEEDEALAEVLQQMMHQPECPQCNKPLTLYTDGNPIYQCHGCRRAWPQSYFDTDEDTGERGYTGKELIRILKTDEGLQQLRTCQQCGYMVLETDVVWENQPATPAETGTVKCCRFCEKANA